MQNNQTCSCGAPAQMACRCKYEIRYFCFDHFGPHTQNNIENHIPLSLAQAVKWAVSSIKHRNYKLYKIDLKLVDYSKKLEEHIILIQSSLEILNSKIDRIFQSKVQKCENLMRSVQEARNSIERYKSRSAEDVIQILTQYKAENIKAVLPDYQSDLEMSMSEVFKELASELGVTIYEEHKCRGKDIDNLERRLKVEIRIRTENENQIRDLNARLDGLAKWKEEARSRINHLEAAYLLKEREMKELNNRIAREITISNKAQAKINELSGSVDDMVKSNSVNESMVQKFKSLISIRDTEIVNLKARVDEESQLRKKAESELDVVDSIKEYMD